MVIDSDVRGVVAPLSLEVNGVAVGPRDVHLDTAIALTERALREAAREVDAAQARTRAMYRRFGVDPTRTRPSSEALLRRIRKGERLPHVNNLVDIVNWCSVESQVPFGLYDGLAIERPFTVRLGLAGEAYAGIRKDRVNVDGRVVIADARGAFGNPTSDSARAMVTDVTTQVLVVLFIPADTPTEQGSAVLQTTRDRFDRFARG